MAEFRTNKRRKLNVLLAGSVICCDDEQICSCGYFPNYSIVASDEGSA